MTSHGPRRPLHRRDFLRYGGAAVAAGAVGGGALQAFLNRPAAAQATAAAMPAPRAFDPAAVDKALHLIGTDGWASLPVPAPGDLAPHLRGKLPDSMAAENTTSYVYGFRDVTGWSDDRAYSLKGRCQLSSPILAFDEGDRIKLQLTNLGWQVRPDIPDGHTLHWHGFPNAIPWFDGVPEMSAGAPINKSLSYYYEPQDPGTYMYHCHWEDVEHVQMGMTGSLYVRPRQRPNMVGNYPGKTAADRYVYNDGNGITAYDREFSFMLMDFFIEAHWNLAHIQQPDWSDYFPDAWMMNGRSYPDTLAPNTSVDDAETAGNVDRLRFQPLSSRVTCNAGDRVLLRFANLGYQRHSMTLPGIRMRIVGRDSNLLRGKDLVTDTTYVTEVLPVAPGQSYDAIFVAPDFDLATAVTASDGRRFNRYLLYDRDFQNDPSGRGASFGGQATEVHVFDPATSLLPQGLDDYNGWGGAAA